MILYWSKYMIEAEMYVDLQPCSEDSYGSDLSKESKPNR